MSTHYYIVFSSGVLAGLLTITIAAMVFLPLEKWERFARAKWAGGKVSLGQKILWRLFRPVTAKELARTALGGAL